mgnify:CR=1 FL=1
MKKISIKTMVKLVELFNEIGSDINSYDNSITMWVDDLDEIDEEFINYMLDIINDKGIVVKRSYGNGNWVTFIFE